MQMRKTTFYAIQIMLGLGNQVKKTIPEMAIIMNIKVSYLRKIMRTLRDEGLVSATSGHGGGYVLNKEANEITLWDIVSIMEGDKDIDCCIGDRQYCNHVKERRYVENLYSDIRKDIIEELSRYSIQDLLSQNAPE